MKHNNFKRCAIYVRSATKQNSHAIAGQIDRCKQHLEKCLGSKSTITSILFVDNGFSGTTLSRPDMKKLIKQIKQGGLDMVVVPRLCSIARNTPLLLKFIALLHERGVDLVSASEDLTIEGTIQSPESNLLHSILAAEAEFKAEIEIKLGGTDI